MDLPDHQASSDIANQLHAVTSAFDESTMSLILFEWAQREGAGPPTKDEWAANSQRRSEISRSLEQHLGDWPFNRELLEKTRVEADRVLMREKWDRGIIPQQVRHRAPFISAKAFLYAADSTGRIPRVPRRSE